MTEVAQRHTGVAWRAAWADRGSERRAASASGGWLAGDSRERRRCAYFVLQSEEDGVEDNGNHSCRSYGYGCNEVAVFKVTGDDDVAV